MSRKLTVTVVQLSLSAILQRVGSGGDVIPFMQIGRRLRQCGHEIKPLTHCHCEEPTRQASV
jgi:hypothetical protein